MNYNFYGKANFTVQRTFIKNVLFCTLFQFYSFFKLNSFHI